jgi:hypothetical protein
MTNISNIAIIIQHALPYWASFRKPALRYSTRKVNDNYLVQRLALIVEMEPDNAF